MAVKSMLEKVAGPAQRRFLAFFSSNIMQKTGQLFLLIGVTILGGADDVYRFGLFISLFALLIPLMSLNAHLSIGRISFDIADECERERYQMACLLAGSAGVVIIGGLIAFALWMEGVDDPLTLGNPAFLAILFVASLLFLANQFFGLMLRLRDRAIPFLIYGALSGAGAIVIFLLAYRAGIQPFLAAVLGYSGAQLSSIAFAALTNRSLFQAPSSQYLLTGLKYSVGTVIFSSVQWIVNYSGRWLAEDALSIRELAIYTVLGQVLVALTMLLTMLYESRRPTILREFAAGRIAEGRRKIDQSFLPALVITALFFVAVSLGNLVAPLVLQLEYRLEWSWIATGLLMSLSYCLSMRTYWLSIGVSRTTAFGFAAIIGAACNLAFVLRYGLDLGIEGLFLGSALGLLVQAGVAHFLLKIALRIDGI